MYPAKKQKKNWQKKKLQSVRTSKGYGLKKITGEYIPWIPQPVIWLDLRIRETARTGESKVIIPVLWTELTEDSSDITTQMLM